MTNGLDPDQARHFVEPDLGQTVQLVNKDIFSKTGLKRQLKKKDQTLAFKTAYRLMQVKSIKECSMRAFCSTFDLHLATMCR